MPNVAQASRWLFPTGNIFPLLAHRNLDLGVVLLLIRGVQSAPFLRASDIRALNPIFDMMAVFVVQYSFQRISGHRTFSRLHVKWLVGVHLGNFTTPKLRRVIHHNSVAVHVLGLRRVQVHWVGMRSSLTE